MVRLGAELRISQVRRLKGRMSSRKYSTREQRQSHCISRRMREASPLLHPRLLCVCSTLATEYSRFEYTNTLYLSSELVRRACACGQPRNGLSATEETPPRRSPSQEVARSRLWLSGKVTQPPRFLVPFGGQRCLGSHETVAAGRPDV